MDQVTSWEDIPPELTAQDIACLSTKDSATIKILAKEIRAEYEKHSKRLKTSVLEGTKIAILDLHLMGLKYEEIAQYFDISALRVQEIISNAKRRLKNNSKGLTTAEDIKAASRKKYNYPLSKTQDIYDTKHTWLKSIEQLVEESRLRLETLEKQYQEYLDKATIKLENTKQWRDAEYAQYAALQDKAERAIVYLENLLKNDVHEIVQIDEVSTTEGLDLLLAAISLAKDGYKCVVVELNNRRENASKQVRLAQAESQCCYSYSFDRDIQWEREKLKNLSKQLEQKQSLTNTTDRP